MLVLPWYVRFGFDVTVTLGAFLLWQRYPRLIFEPFRDGKRVNRRRTVEEAEGFMLKQDPTVSAEEAAAIYKGLRREGL